MIEPRSVRLVSFYTPNGEYPEHAKRLAAEAEALGLDAHIAELPDAGGYLENCRLKPLYLASVLRAFSSPILWLDVDSSLLSVPTGLRDDVDFMGRAKPDGDARVWHVDAMFFAPTEAALALVDLWADCLTDHSDEYAFDVAWRSGRWAGTWERLPSEYDDSPGGVVSYRRSKSPEKDAARRALRGRPYATG